MADEIPNLHQPAHNFLIGRLPGQPRKYQVTAVRDGLHSLRNLLNSSASQTLLDLEHVNIKIEVS